jgi:PadR family transcriptional regulator PadR
MGSAREQVLTQLRKGVLDYCVLSVLTRGPSYGLSLASELARMDVLFTSGGALYPLLARLRKSGWVETYWQESNAGPPRRYYRITATGRRALEEFMEAWKPFVTQADIILEGATSDDEPT